MLKKLYLMLCNFLLNVFSALFQGLMTVLTGNEINGRWSLTCVQYCKQLKDLSADECCLHKMCVLWQISSR